MTSVPFGGSQTYTITPADHYHIADVQVDGNTVGTVTIYALQGIQGNHAIEAIFAIDIYTVTTSIESEMSPLARAYM